MVTYNLFLLVGCRCGVCRRFCPQSFFRRGPQSSNDKCPSTSGSDLLGSQYQRAADGRGTRRVHSVDQQVEDILFTGSANELRGPQSDRVFLPLVWEPGTGTGIPGPVAGISGLRAGITAPGPGAPSPRAGPCARRQEIPALWPIRKLMRWFSFDDVSSWWKDDYFTTLMVLQYACNTGSCDVRPYGFGE